MKALIITLFILSGATDSNGYGQRYEDKGKEPQEGVKPHNFQRPPYVRDTYMRLITDTYREGDAVMTRGLAITLRSRFSVPFEVGYVFCALQDRYRRMVDKFHTSKDNIAELFVMELVLYLSDIELEYWTFEHMVSAMEQLERKFLIFNSMTDAYKDTLLTRRTTASIKIPDMSATAGAHTRRNRTRSYTRTPRLKHRTDFENRWSKARTRSKSKRFWWPIEYGWEIDWDWNDDPNFKDNIKYYDKSDPNFTVTAPPSYEETDSLTVSLDKQNMGALI